MLKKLWKNHAPELLFAALSLAVGGLGGLFTWLGMDAYEAVNKPWFTPPAAVFPIVWTVLYVLMGWGMGRVWKSGTPVFWAVWTFGVQLGMNLLWTVWFFLLQRYLAAFVWLLGLILAVVLMIWAFARADRAAALLQVPYLLWLCFASVLNLSIFLLN